MSNKLSKITTVDFLREAFRYDPSEGILYWQDDRPKDHFKKESSYKAWKTSYSGKPAGCKAKVRCVTYLIVKVAGIRTSVQQVIFAITYGRFAEIVDHVDGDGLNNKLDNLRESCLVRNAKNQRRNVNNKSGISGVYWLSKEQKWKVRGWLSSKGKSSCISLGQYDTLFEAACVRISWLNSNGFSDTHGRRD